MRIGLKCFHTGGQVVVLNVNNAHPLADRPVYCLIDTVDDLFVVLRDVVLQVDDDQDAVFHAILQFPLPQAQYSIIKIYWQGI